MNDVTEGLDHLIGEGKFILDLAVNPELPATGLDPGDRVT